MNDTAGLSLPSILAYARAGSLERAWSLLVAGGHDTSEEPGALTLKGRLLKDRAALAAGEERLGLLGQAAAAYRRAAEITGATYPRINAATLSLLSGDTAKAHLLARQILDHIDAHPDEPETPYYRAATRAEALLLLGQAGEARTALEEAVALAPRAWEDHATTIRQFALILAALDEDSAWLDGVRPHRSLHFGGHMSFRADGDHAALTARIAALLLTERIGFGYGALAAGADILIAEALLEAGAELHLLLPGGVAAFAALSVDPFGPEWRRRFDAALGCATSVRAVEPLGAPDHALLDLAGEVAMGAAIGNARRLATDAVQLLVLPEDVGESAERARRAWVQGDPNRRQHVLAAPRETETVSPATARQDRIALLAVRLGEANASTLSAVKRALAEADFTAPVFTGELVLAGFERPDTAARAACAIAGDLGAAASVGCDYGVGLRIEDPFGGGKRAVGRIVALAGAAARSTLAGSVSATEDFAAALELYASGMRTEFIGELEGGAAPIGLYAVRRAL